MANHVGVDLSNQQVRVLETEGTAKKLKLKKFRRTDTFKPGDQTSTAFLDKEFSKPIDDLFSEGKISREPTAMSWDSDLTIFREIELPFVGVEQIRKVIKYEAEGHLLNCDIDDVVISFYRLAETKEKSHVMVMAVRKDLLLNRLEVLARAGVDPLVSDLDVMAEFNALSALGYTKDHKSFMLLDCGRRTTNLLLISDNRLIAGRAMRIGSDQLVKRIAEDLEADPSDIAAQTGRLLTSAADEQAGDLVVTARAAKGEATEETKKLPVELARDLAHQRAGDFFVKLSREVRRTLATARVPEGVEVVYVTGPGSKLPGFVEGITRGLGIDAPVKPLGLLERVESSLSPEEAADAEVECLTALGLCFKLAGYDETGIDFRQDEAKYARKFDQVREPLIYLGGLVLFFVLLVNLLDIRLLSLKTPFLVETDKAEMSKIHKEAVDAFATGMGEAAKLPGAMAKPTIASMNFIKTQLLNRVDKLKGELGRGGSINELPSAFAMWKDAFDHIATKMPGIKKLYLDSMTVQVLSSDYPSIELNGYVPDAAAFEELRDALSQIPNVKVNSPQTGPKMVGGVELYAFSKLIVEYPKRQDTGS